MKIKKSYLLIIIFSIIFSLTISCSNQLTNPNNINTSSVKAVTSGIHIIQYGSKTSEVNAAYKDELKKLWLGLVAGKTVYKANNYTAVSGKFDDKGNYYDITDQSNIRTEFIESAVYEYNNKKYLAGIYWDNKIGIGMLERYRLIITDENGEEQAWYGGGNDKDVKPNENTHWTKYNFVFGYLKDY